jgi:hypothetical protein
VASPAFRCAPSVRRDGGSLGAELERRTAPIDAPEGASPILAALWEAADQFVVTGDGGGRTILAGYPWFTDRGRDAMIALPGLLLARGRHGEARAVLETFARPSGTDDPNGGASDGARMERADAALWFVLAARAYLVATKDLPFVQKTLLPKVVAIIRGFATGVCPGVRIDGDGLVIAGTQASQLTWMNAREGGWTVTPRQGKAVELNALWINALRTIEAMAARLEHADLSARTGAAAAARPSSGRSSGTSPAAACTTSSTAARRRIDPPEPGLRACSRTASSTPTGAGRAGASSRVASRPWGFAPSPPKIRLPLALRGRRARPRSGVPPGTAWPWLLGPTPTRGPRGGRHAGTRASIRSVPRSRRTFGVGLGTVSGGFDAEPPQRPGGCVTSLERR